MIAYFTCKKNRVAVKLSGICFGLGSLLFLVNLLTNNISYFTIIGIIFLALYIISNSIMLLILFINLLIHYKKFQEHFTAIVILLLNIPVAFLFIYFLTHL